MTEIGAGEVTQMIAPAAAGDDVAFARIVAAHHAELVRICHMVARHRTVAEEATQAAWSIAWRKLGTVRQADRLRPWLITVAAGEPGIADPGWVAVQQPVTVARRVRAVSGRGRPA